MSPPLVSVVIPAYNNGPLLVEAIQSALDQSYSPIEIIVVDDASSDDTPDLVREFGTRIRYIRLADNSGGPARPRNTGIEASRGAYVSLFDADDLMGPEKIAEEVALLENHPDIAFVFSDFENVFVDSRREPFLATHRKFQHMPKTELHAGRFRIRRKVAFETLIADNFVGTSSIVCRRGLFAKAGTFDHSLTNSDDIDWIFRVTDVTDLGYVDRALHGRRIHGGNISSRPKALVCRALIRERLWLKPLTRKARRYLRAYLSEVHLSLGYNAVCTEEFSEACRHYRKAWVLRKCHPKTLHALCGLVWRRFRCGLGLPKYQPGPGP